MNSVTEITIVKTVFGTLCFATKWQMFQIRTAPDGDGFAMYEASYHTHRFGRPLKRKNQIPRWRLVARLSSLPTLHEGGRVPLMDDMGNFPKMSRRK